MLGGGRFPGTYIKPCVKLSFDLGVTQVKNTWRPRNLRLARILFNGRTVGGDEWRGGGGGASRRGATTCGGDVRGVASRLFRAPSGRQRSTGSRLVGRRLERRGRSGEARQVWELAGVMLGLWVGWSALLARCEGLGAG